MCVCVCVCVCVRVLPLPALPEPEGCARDTAGPGTSERDTCAHPASSHHSSHQSPPGQSAGREKR